MFEKSSEHIRNSLIMLEIGWKSLEIVAGPVLKSSEVVENLRKLLETFGDLRKSFEIFDKLSSEAVGKSSEIHILWRRKISCILLKKR